MQSSPRSSVTLRDLPPRAHSLSAEEMDRVFGGSGSCGTTGDPCGKDGPDCCDGYSCNEGLVLGDATNAAMTITSPPARSSSPSCVSGL